MNRTLVTFLGRAPRDENGYRTTACRFTDGSCSEPVAFPGWELARRPRPVLYLFEAVITRLCQMARVEVQDFEGREWARSNYEERPRAFHDERNRYRLLKNLRNQVAHGTRPSKGEVQKVLLDRNRLRETLESLWQAVNDGDPPSERTLKHSRG